MDDAVAISKARFFLSAGRPKEALKEAQRYLAVNPDSGPGHAMAALCFSSLEEHKSARHHAQQALRFDPDEPFSLYINAFILHLDDDEKEAREFILQAIALEPEDERYWKLLAGIELELDHPREALAAAEKALECDPEDVDSSNLRAIALQKLGRKDDAEVQLRSSLSKDPENPTTHANLGWTHLRQGRYTEAMGCFQEAMRLDPTDEWTREGIVEALKAKNPLYRPVLWMIFFFERIGQKGSWWLIIGLWVLIRILRGLAKSNPAMEVWITPIIYLYLAIVLVSWSAVPLFNATLLFSRLGRAALPKRDKIRALPVATLVVLAIIGASFWALGEIGIGIPLAIFAGGLLFPFGALAGARGSNATKILAGIAIILLVLGVISMVQMFSDGKSPLIMFFVGGCVVSSWASLFILSRDKG